MTDIKDFAFNFNNIELLYKFAGYPPSTDGPFEFKVEFQRLIHPAIRVVNYFYAVSLFWNKTVSVGAFILRCQFFLPDFDEVYNEKERCLPDSIDWGLIIMSMGTCRGIIWNELRATVFSGSIMPSFQKDQLKPGTFVEPGDGETYRLIPTNILLNNPPNQ